MISLAGAGRYPIGSIAVSNAHFFCTAHCIKYAVIGKMGISILYLVMLGLLCAMESVEKPDTSVMSYCKKTLWLTERLPDLRMYALDLPFCTFSFGQMEMKNKISHST